MNRTQLCHPLLSFIINSIDKDINLPEWIAAQPDSIVIENLGPFSKNDIRYYYQKYLLMKENGYFSPIDQKEKLSGEISAQTIKSSLANAKQLVYETTDCCGLDCGYCGYGKFYCDYDKRENKNIDIKSAKLLLNYLLELWNSPLNRSHDRNIYISFYGGEPLLNFSFIEEMVRYVKSLNWVHNTYTFSMTTNGVLLDRYMDFLAENRFNLLISLDGNEKNNEYRVFKNGQPSYETVIKNVNLLREKYPDYFNECVNFNAVLHDKNSVGEIFHYFKTEFNKIPSIGALNTSGIAESQKEEFRKAYTNVRESLYKSEDYALIEKDMFVRLPTVQEVMIFLHRYMDFCYEDYMDLLHDKKDQKILPTGTCVPFSKKIFMTVNGKILPCERIGQQFGLGSVSPDKVELDCEQIASRFNEYFRKMRPLCTSCRMTGSCMQCVFNLNIDDEHPVCRGCMSDKDFSAYLASFIEKIEKEPGIYSKILNDVVVD